MIASLRGSVQHVTLDAVILDVGGVGYRIQAAPATLAPLRVGAQAQLATSLVVREDSMTLFGFADAQEREMFETLQTVSGVGPRLALATLAVHTPDALRQAVQSEDAKALTRVPGIGLKGAKRMLLELAGTLGPALSDETPAQPQPAGTRGDVVAALAGLGWNAKAAEEATDAAIAADPDEDVGALLRAALQRLGGTRA